MNYVFDDAKNKIEGMSREQIIAAIAQATGQTPQDTDDAFITQILEQNGNKSIKLWVGKQAEYNLIAEPDENTLYCITDPQETNELQEQINVLQSEINNLIVPDMGNVRGWTIESQTEQADNITVNPVIGGKDFRKDFTLPDGAIVIEVSYIAVKDVPSTVWETDGAYWGDLLPQEEGDPTHYVIVNKDSSFTAVYFKVTYAYPSNGDLAELYDIRVGYDGTVYETAGEAVRKQVQSVWFNESVKVALLNLLAKVAYIDNKGQVYFEELQRALYAGPDVETITAVFDQGQNVIYDNDSLEDLRQYLTVTANYKNGTSAEVEEYTLIGTLEAGTSEITVFYGGKTDTFTAAVTAYLPSGYTKYDYIAYSSAIGSSIPSDGGLLTDVSLSSDNQFETSIYYPSGTNSNSQNVIGTRAGASGTKEFGLFLVQSTGKLGYWFAGTDTATEILALVSNYINKIVVKPVGKSAVYPQNVVISVNGTDYNAGSNASGTTFSAWMGFFRYAISATSTNTQTSNAVNIGIRIGETIIKDSSDNVIHHLIPAYNGTYYGIYDRVTGNFYSKTTYFTCGNWS